MQLSCFSSSSQQIGQTLLEEMCPQCFISSSKCCPGQCLPVVQSQLSFWKTWVILDFGCLLWCLAGSKLKPPLLTYLLPKLIRIGSFTIPQLRLNQMIRDRHSRFLSSSLEIFMNFVSIVASAISHLPF